MFSGKNKMFDFSNDMKYILETGIDQKNYDGLRIKVQSNLTLLCIYTY